MQASREPVHTGFLGSHSHSALFSDELSSGGEELTQDATFGQSSSPPGRPSLGPKGSHQALSLHLTGSREAPAWTGLDFSAPRLLGLSESQGQVRRASVRSRPSAA